MQAVRETAVLDGFLLRPDGGATLAAWKIALETGSVSKDERVVLFNCATGFKYPMPGRSSRLDRHSAVTLASL
jgi:threonine synthase